jgi:curved DNA-binding protein CbpA
MGDPYAVLGVEPDADESVVRQRYRSLLKEYHPDQGGSREAFMQVRRAYEAVVSGERERAADGGARARASTSGSAGEGGVGATTARGSGAGTGTASSGRAGGTTGSETTGVDATMGFDESRGLFEDGEYLTVVLRGVVEDMDLEPVVASHRADGTRRTVAFFEVRNTSDRRVPWRGHQHARFVGTDGYMYEGATHLRPHADKLPPRWKGGDVEVEPGARVNGVVICQELPASVDVARVAYTQQVFGAGRGIEGTEQFVFDVADAESAGFDQIPF